ncbi:hypothetical protein ACTFIV_005020 [Dictyostelium citrinum]
MATIINKRSFLFYIFLIFYLFCKVSCQIKYEVTCINSQLELDTYPSPIGDLTCKISINIIATNILDQSGPPVQVFLDSQGVFVYASKVRNETSAIYNFDIEVSNGNYTSNITVPGFPESNNSINYSYVDVSKLSVSLFNDITFNEMSYYSAVFKLNGLPRPLILSNTASYTIIKLSDTFLYRIKFINSFVRTQKTSNWNITLPINGDEFSFNILYTYETSPTILDSEITDITLYPNQTNVQAMPVFYNQIIKFKLTKTNITYLPNLQLSYYGIFDLVVRPILGSLGNIEFISTCYSYMSGPYSLFYQNGQLNYNSFDFTNSITIPITELSDNITYPLLNNKTIPIYTISLNFNKNYDFKIVHYDATDQFNSYLETFPYAFTEGNNLNFNLTVSTNIYEFCVQDMTFAFTSASFFKSILFNSFYVVPYNETLRGIIQDFNSIYLGNFKYLLQFSLSTIGPYPIKSIRYKGSSDQSSFFLTPSNVVSGDLFNGVWETIYDGVLGGKDSKESIKVLTYSGIASLYKIGLPISFINQKSFQLPSVEINEFNFEDLVNITFLYNNVHVTNQSVSNIIYFNFTNISNYKDLSIGFSLMDPKTLVDNKYEQTININLGEVNEYYIFAEWVDNRYQVMFDIPANTMPGIANYYLTFSKEIKIFSSELPQSAQLNLISKNIDIYGPIFSKIIKNPSNLPQDTFGWLVTIEDNVNGLNNGYITVRGTIDSSLHNFTIEPSKAIKGDKWVGEYEIYIKEHQSQCIHQSYEITDVVLYDTFNNIVSYIKYSESPVSSQYNPFIYYLNDTTIVTVTPNNICSGISDASGPTLLSFKSSTPSLDVGSLNGRNITFEFESQDQQTGIRENQFPIVYLTTLNLDIHKCISTNSTPFQTTTKFTCTTTVPIGFGYPTGIIFSVYGFINNGGYYSGYSTQSLIDLGFDNSLNTTIYTENQPIITSTNSITNYGGSLMIYGRKLAYGNIGDIQSILVLLKYSDDGNGGIYISFTPKTIYDSFILIEGIRATNQSFTIKITSSSTSIESNEFTVTPKLFFFNYTAPIEPTISPTTSPSSTPTTSPSLTPIPTVSPIPTNPPQKCQGNPECGGSNQGICKEGGCVCYPPFIGLTCTSQIIIVPQPSTNSTNPSTEIPIPPTDNSQDSEDISKAIFKSLISLVSLRELNFKGEETKLYTFDKWIFTPLNNNKNLYETSINSNSNTITNISATLEWFNKSTTVEFANQQLQMNPSSIKYTIEINEYPFSQSLNTLQLVMSASLISSEIDDICSSKEFGNTTNGDDSNFLKIQVDNHSVYGRFIKRAIIDSKVQSIENILLDSTMKPISTSHSTQSYIGITIPQYSKQVIIDPDFSIIIDQRAASSNSENSICSNNSSSLTKGQIAGIIIGGVAFLAVIIACVVYYFYKKKKDKQLQKTLKRKLEKVG